jgi:kynurenine formamidase
LDAPYHFFPNLKKVQDIDLKFLSGITYIIDMGYKCIDNPDYMLTLNDLKKFD